MAALTARQAPPQTQVATKAPMSRAEPMPTPAARQFQHRHWRWCQRHRRRHDQHGARSVGFGDRHSIPSPSAPARWPPARSPRARRRFASNGGAAFGDFAAASGANSTAVGPKSAPHTPTLPPSATGPRRRAPTSRCSARRPTPNHVRPYLEREQAGARLARKSRDVEPGRRPRGLYAGPAGSCVDERSRKRVLWFQGQVNHLISRDGQLAEGIAASAALAQPIILPGQHFAMRAGWGGYDGSNAVGFSACGGSRQ